MGKRIILLILGILSVSWFLGYRNYISNSYLYGVFVNDYKKIDIKYAEFSDIADTLILYPDSRFTSGFYGSGTYEVNRGLGYSKLVLSYEYKFGKGQIVLPIKRSFSGKIMLNVNKDLCINYTKIY